MTRRQQLAALAWGVMAATGLAGRAGAQQRDAATRDIPAAAVSTYNAERTMRVTGVLEVAAERTIEGDVAVLNGPVRVAGRVTGTLGHLGWPQAGARVNPARSAHREGHGPPGSIAT